MCHASHVFLYREYFLKSACARFFSRVMRYLKTLFAVANCYTRSISKLVLSKSFIIPSNVHKLCKTFHSCMNDQQTEGLCYPRAKDFQNKFLASAWLDFSFLSQLKKSNTKLLVGRIVFLTREMTICGLWLVKSNGQTKIY